MGTIVHALKFSLLKDEALLLKTVAEIFGRALDPPVFYSAGILEVLHQTTHKPLVLAVLQKNDHTLVALPLVKNKVWENADFPGWDNLDVLVDQNASPEEIATFWKLLLRKTKVLKLCSITQNSSAVALASKDKHPFIDRRKCPYVPLFKDWDELNTQISKKLVRNIRQYSNKAEREGITFKIYEGHQLSKTEKIEKLKIAFAFHNVRMSHINQDSKFTPEAFANYHQDVLTQANNVFVIEAINQSKETIACFYGLQNKNRLAYFNGGYNQDYALYSIGTLLVAELIDYAMKNGIKIFDFLRGNESYKQKWTEVYDLNKDLYLSDRRPINKVRTTYLFFQDTRKRIGTKNALKTVFSGN